MRDPCGQGIPYRSAREQASELMGYARDLSLTGAKGASIFLLLCSPFATQGRSYN
ncbi:hypothetical protein D3C81_368540 [compost metagenome]